MSTSKLPLTWFRNESVILIMHCCILPNFFWKTRKGSPIWQPGSVSHKVENFFHLIKPVSLNASPVWLCRDWIFHSLLKTFQTPGWYIFIEWIKTCYPQFNYCSNNKTGKYKNNNFNS